MASNTLGFDHWDLNNDRKIPDKIDLFIGRFFGNDVPPESVSEDFLDQFRIVSLSDVNCVPSFFRSFISDSDTVIYQAHKKQVTLKFSPELWTDKSLERRNLCLCLL